MYLSLTMQKKCDSYVLNYLSFTEKISSRCSVIIPNQWCHYQVQYMLWSWCQFAITLTVTITRSTRFDQHLIIIRCTMYCDAWCTTVYIWYHDMLSNEQPGDILLLKLIFKLTVIIITDNSVALVCEWTILIERPLLIGEVSVNVLRI
jgi:hypothetical protein